MKNSNAKCMWRRPVYDTMIHEIIGPTAITQDFPAEDITPEYDAFGLDLLVLNPDHGDIEVTPKHSDNYIIAEILLLQGGCHGQRTCD